MFNGVGNEYPNQFLFLAKVMWEAQGIMDDQMKKEILASDSQECALNWYMKYCTDNPMSVLVDIHTAMNKEFSRPKFEVQSIVGFKEIMMKPGEMT